MSLAAIKRVSAPVPAPRPPIPTVPPNVPQGKGDVLADGRDYRLVTLTPVAGSGGGVTPPQREVGLRPPRTDGHDGGTAPPAPGRHYTNVEIERAAQPFIVAFERERGDYEIVRQGTLVGADYLSVRGGVTDRYIEVKAFGGTAGDSFELTRAERKAAGEPAIAPRYWVYVVEHLRDGESPVVTALFNPIADPQLSKEPVGAVNIRGWRATTQVVGRFALAWDNVPGGGEFGQEMVSP